MNLDGVTARDSKSWGWLCVGDVCVCVARRCGSTSLVTALNAGKHWRDAYPPMEAMEAKALGLPMILGVRDPVSRFKSFWSETQTARQWAEMRGWSPVRLLLFVKRHLHADPHWRPQFDYYVDGVEVVRFDRLLERVGLEPRHDHKSTVPHPEVPEDEINRVYADDVFLWRLANERA